MTSLNIIRQKSINAFNYLLIFSCITVGILDIYHGNTIKLFLNAFSIISYLASIYFSYKEKTELSIIITCASVNTLCFSVCYVEISEPLEIIPQILYCITITLFLLSANKVRMLYIGICSILLTLIVFKFNYELDKSILTLVQVIACLFLQNLFVIFVENQDDQLNGHLEKLEKSNLNIERLNKSLKRKNEEIVAYSNVMTHDLKAPLRNIIAFIGLIKKKQEMMNTKSLEFFSVIESSAKSMNSLISNLLDYSKAGNSSINIEDVNIGVIVTEVSSIFRFDMDNGNVKFEFDELPVIKGDKQLLKTLFQNLLSNSIKYQPQNKIGHIPTIKLSTKTDNQYDYIIISDNGIGINKDFEKELFEPFKRYHSSSEYEGTGLGMSICKNVLLQHEGKIELVKTSENGTTFQLSFSKYLK